MRNSFPVSATGPETLWCLCFWELTSLPCKKQALPEELNKADCCQYFQHLSVLLKHCTGFYGKQRKIERQVRHDIMYWTNRISYFLEKGISLKDSCSCNKNMTSSCILTQRRVRGFNQNYFVNKDSLQTLIFQLVSFHLAYFSPVHVSLWSIVWSAASRHLHQNQFEVPWKPEW